MLTELVIIGLGAWRMALLLTDDVGPWSAMDHVRQLLRADAGARRQKVLQQIARGQAIAGVDTDSVALDIQLEANGWEKLWSCMRCMTFWSALGLYGLWQLDQRPVEVLAIWGLAQIVDFVRTGGA
jgi:hypothetical protein